jgi:hypothetical protein
MNRDRAARRLAALSRHDGLSEIARAHSTQMATLSVLEHSVQLGRTVAGVISTFRLVAENVGSGPTAIAVHDAFMRSEAHRANILGDFNLVGVGVAADAGGQLWVTEIFVKDSTAPAPPPPPPPTKAPAKTPPPQPPSVKAAAAPTPAPPRDPPSSSAPDPASQAPGVPAQAPAALTDLPPDRASAEGDTAGGRGGVLFVAALGALAACTILAVASRRKRWL